VDFGDDGAVNGPQDDAVFERFEPLPYVPAAK
jgi:hypothetical protein